jgi:hypothetical protein
VRQAVEQIIQENPHITIRAEVATYILLGMLNWLVHWCDPQGKISPEELTSNVTGIFLSGLKAREGRNSPRSSSPGPRDDAGANALCSRKILSLSSVRASR